MPFFFQWVASLLIGAAVGLAIFQLPPFFRYAVLILVFAAPVLYVFSFNINWPVLLGRRRRPEPSGGRPPSPVQTGRDDNHDTGGADHSGLEQKGRD